MTTNHNFGEILASDLQRASIIGDLKSTCASEESNIYLKGSLVRGDAPYGDVDLLLVGDKEAEESTIPNKVSGIQVNYSTLDKETFREYLNSTPRSWGILHENIAIREVDPEVSELIIGAGSDLIANKLPDYLLYLAVEHRLYGQRSDLVTDDYYSQKRKPGSKRSIMRALYVVKAMTPEYYEIQSTHDLLEQLKVDGVINASIQDDIGEVFTMLHNKTFDSNWAYRTARVEEWVMDIMEQARTKADGSLPDDYKNSIDQGLSEELIDSDIEKLTKSHATLPPFRSWVLDLTLASNPNTPEDMLHHIWKRGQDRYSWRVINRYLVRNPSFPLERVPESEINTDSYLKATILRLGYIGRLGADLAG